LLPPPVESDPPDDVVPELEVELLSEELEDDEESDVVGDDVLVVSLDEPFDSLVEDPEDPVDAEVFDFFDRLSVL
jgi:hypothetical protein